MKAIMVREWTDPQQFLLEDIPIPTPGPGEVLVAVHTAAVGFGDTLIATGKYQVRPVLPFTPGLECSGTVAKVGRGVTQLKPGDRVAAVGFVGEAREQRRLLGTFGEMIVAPIRNLIRIPDAVDLETAALFRSNTETTYYALQEGRLKPNETLLVLGAGGGTGYAAVTLGKLMGARVIASASSSEKRDIAKAGGADVTIDSAAADWRAQVNAAASSVDVIYDPVGGDQTERAFRTLGYGGRHVVIGFATGAIPKLAMNLPLMKASSIIGANWLSCWDAEPERTAANAKYLIDLLAAGKLSTPPIARRFALSQTGEALREVASGKVAGRIVVTVAAAS